jgi:hypothetical protein
MCPEEMLSDAGVAAKVKLTTGSETLGEVLGRKLVSPL